MKALVAMVALVTAASAGAVTVSSTAGAPDPGPAPGQNLVMTFDSAAPAGWSLTGGYATRVGSVSGVAASPAGDATRYAYVSPATGQPATLSFATALRSVSLYWGSIDTYNTLDVLGAGGVLLGSIPGGILPPANGNQGAGLTNRRVYISAGGFGITGLVFRSTQAAFEFDDIAGAAVPEPQSWALLIAGMGLVGLAARRRRITVSA